MSKLRTLPDACGLAISGVPVMIGCSGRCTGASQRLHLSPSSRGPGRGPFKAKTRVRIPLGTYSLPRDFLHCRLTLASDRASLPSSQTGCVRRPSASLLTATIGSPSTGCQMRSAGWPAKSVIRMCTSLAPHVGRCHRETHPHTAPDRLACPAAQSASRSIVVAFRRSGAGGRIDSNLPIIV